ncbi:hypothetical protein AVEN_34562-1 [Araneus ventricosus]|uniref:Uncharacterized protein n=1 Tax=Araneus ventricosus TaxID=182803 RepID=A0A4Y2AZS1_ARAVE|nr:hypothetical protein AVEN_34562-1 [Araneus ventricosus]
MEVISRSIRAICVDFTCKAKCFKACYGHTFGDFLCANQHIALLVNSVFHNSNCLEDFTPPITPETYCTQFHQINLRDNHMIQCLWEDLSYRTDLWTYRFVNQNI